jgi:L-rhamnose mutarotase
MIERIQKLTLANDSLQKQVITPLRDSIARLNTAHKTEISGLESQIKTLESDKAGLNKKVKDFEKDVADLNRNKIKIERDTLQKRVERLTANVAGLEQKIRDKDKQIAEEQEIGRQMAKEEHEKGKNVSLAKIVETYKDKKFDHLILSSTGPSVGRDRLLVGHIEEVKQVLSDLETYFKAKELFVKKFNAAQIKDTQTQLNQIQQQSELLDKLKENVENYQIFTEGLQESIKKIIALDDEESVAGMPEEIQKKKFNKILAELSSYIFNYDFNFEDYPYLSNIVLEIIKRKQPNADANIKDLLTKL